MLAACLSVGVEANTGPSGEEAACASPGSPGENAQLCAGNSNAYTLK